MVSDHTHDLIQKYLDGLASEAELIELEGLLAGDPEIADAFADAARLHANLQEHFQQQYKIDQVAALLESPEAAPSPATGQAEGRVIDPSWTGEGPAPMPAGSAYFPIMSRLEKARRSRNATRLKAAARSGKW